MFPANPGPNPCRPGATFSIVAALLACLGTLVSTGDAQEPPPANLLSRYETLQGTRLERDCGFSRAISSTETLWIFCDTAAYAQNTDDLLPGGLVMGSTAARSAITPGFVPQDLAELGTAPLQGETDRPQLFLSNPTGLTKPSGESCTGGEATQVSWITGVAAIPSSSRLLITFHEVCLLGVGMFATPHIRGVGVVEYDAQAHHFGTRTTLFRAAAGAEVPAQWQLGSPVIRDGVLFLFASECRAKDALNIGCIDGAVYVANTFAAPGFWHDASSYHWHDGSSYPAWVKNPSAAVSIIPDAKPLAIAVDADPDKGFVLIAQNDIGGRFTTWLAASGHPLRGWVEGSHVPELPGCGRAKGLDLCRALIPHPEFSTDDRLMISYYTPEAFSFESPAGEGDDPDGHVRLFTVPW
jgi:hypothetical protein